MTQRRDNLHADLRAFSGVGAIGSSEVHGHIAIFIELTRFSWLLATKTRVKRAIAKWQREQAEQGVACVVDVAWGTP